MLKFTINDLLELRLEDGKTNIYVNNQLFNHCKYILLNVPIDELKNIPRINSIDKAVEIIDERLEYSSANAPNIASETLFFAHCSNLQAWYESNYNSCLIHSNLAFPLLKELTKAGDYLAIVVLKEEIAQRFESGFLNVIQFLVNEDYLNYLNKEELNLVLDQSLSVIIDSVINQLKTYIKSRFSNYKTIKDLIDTILLIDLKYYQNILIQVFNALPGALKGHYARLILLHLNYKDYFPYKIPYGRFFTYFEYLFNYLYEKYPEIKDLLIILEGGFYNDSLPFDEKLSFGSISYHRNM